MLLEVDDDALCDLGVTSKMHRKKILKNLELLRAGEIPKAADQVKRHKRKRSPASRPAATAAPAKKAKTAGGSAGKLDHNVIEAGGEVRVSALHGIGVNCLMPCNRRLSCVSWTPQYFLAVEVKTPVTVRDVCEEENLPCNRGAGVELGRQSCTDESGVQVADTIS